MMSKGNDHTVPFRSEADNNLSSTLGIRDRNQYPTRAATEQDQRAFSWLSESFFDYEEAYISIIGLLCRNTCEWIEIEDKFRAWFLSDSAAVLGVCGPPGCGVSASNSAQSLV